jgi:hypothetical protein
MFANVVRRSRPGTLAGLTILAALPGCATLEQPAAHPEPVRLPAGATLIGLGGGDVEGVMGQPVLIRQEAGAQYWRYRLAGCQLDLFLYGDPTDGSVRVAYLDARAAVGAPPESKQACADLARDLRAGVAPTERHPLPRISDPL